MKMSSKLFTWWLISTLIDRAVVRASFERRFSVEVMAAKYEGAYANVIARNDTRRLRIAATEDRKLAPASALPTRCQSLPSPAARSSA